METINDRFEIVCNALFSGNKASMAKSIGLHPTGLSNYLSTKRRSKPNVDMVAELVRTAHVNPLWLLLGEGEMLQSGDHSRHTVTVRDSEVSGNAIVANEVSKVSTDTSCEINYLRERIALLERLLADKERIISLYEKFNRGE